MKSVRILAALGFASLVLTGCDQKPAQEAAKPPTLFTFEDYMEPPFLAEYKKQFNETPPHAIFASEDEAFAKMRSGYKPDVMGPCFYEFPRWQEAGLIQPIDTTKLKNWSKVSATLRNLPGISAGEGKVWFVPQYWGNTSITFRTDLAPEYVEKQSWDILFDPKYKGRVSVLEGVDDTVPFIAHMMGIDAYNMTPEQWEKVKGKLKELVKQVRMVSSDDTALSQGIASGEIVAAMTWRITYSTLKKEGRPVAYMNPPGGMFTYVCGLVMHKETPNVEKALALIDSSLSDEAANYTINSIGDEPSNDTVLAALPNKTFEDLGLTRDVDAFLKGGIFQRRLKNKDEIINAWTEIQSGL